MYSDLFQTAMNKELETKLVARWPKWFNVNGSIQRTLMPFGFECGDGWFDIIWRLCENIDSLAGPEFEVMQVKEKFGGLRFYTYNGSPEIDKMIEQAESESYKTCEVCGEPGKPQGKSWIKTVCEKHAR